MLATSFWRELRSGRRPPSPRQLVGEAGAGRAGRGRGGQLPELCSVRRCGCSRALAASASLTTHGLAAGLPLDLRPFWAPEPMRARAPPPLLQLSCNPGAPGAGGGMTAA